MPGSSGAFLVARRLGLDADILRRSEELLGDRRAGIEELLTAVTEERRRLDAEGAAADTARREAEARERAVRARELKTQKGGLRRGGGGDTPRARDTLDELRVKLRKVEAETPEVVAHAKAQLAAVAQEIANRAPAAASVGGRPAREAELVPGVVVVVASLGGSRGQVVSAPEKGRVTVQVGALRSTVAFDELRLDDRPLPKRTPSGPSPKRRTPAPATTMTLAGPEARRSSSRRRARPTPGSTCAACASTSRWPRSIASSTTRCSPTAR